MALTRMTDNWMNQIDNKNIVGAVLFDFGSAFEVTDHELLLKKLLLMVLV